MVMPEFIIFIPEREVFRFLLRIQYAICFLFSIYAEPYRNFVRAVVLLGINTLIDIMARMGSRKAKKSRIMNNERLEYLGDAVIEFLST